MPIDNVTANSSQIGTYHLSDNPQLFEIQRNNTYQFIVTDIDDILRAGAIGTEKNARFANAQEMLSLAIAEAPIPHFSQETIEVKRGNSTLKYAGVPTFNSGSLTFNDFIGADVKSILMAWQNLSYNVYTEKVGSLDVTKYKKDAYLIEYTPDYRKVRTWILHGCWIKELNESNYANDNGDKHQISCTIEYDRAEIDLTDVAP